MKETILYIDDEPTNLFLFTSIFEDEFNIVTGLSGFEGLNKLKQYPEIRIVLSDMKMPEMNGLEFINQARKKYEKKVYFLVTGYSINKEIIDALKKKVISKYFNKPFDVEEIKKGIFSYL